MNHDMNNIFCRLHESSTHVECKIVKLFSFQKDFRQPHVCNDANRLKLSIVVDCKSHLVWA